MKRSCGVLMHITSLPSPYGIGTFGQECEKFVDWLRASGQSYWQVLPLTPTGYGDSPYQSFSAFAGNPLLIDFNDLVRDGLLTKAQCDEAEIGADPSFVDFEKVYRSKMKLLQSAFMSFSEDVGYLAFIQEEAEWLEDYALFMTIKSLYEQKSWLHWERDLRVRKAEAIALIKEEHAEKISFWKFVQYIFSRQWSMLKRYANKNGIKIIGDIPVYVAEDSADVWAHPDLYLLDSEGVPTKVAGVPPDYFSETGQLWGNPLYNWDLMAKEGFLWWIKRIRKANELYDVVRIDHFRAFDTYYSIPHGETTAINGKWEKGPGIALFNAIRAELGNVEIIAEDLGEIFDSVKELLRESKFPGMRVMQFGFNPEYADNDHLPHNYPVNSVVYTGTHDNSTVLGWYKAADGKSRAMAKTYAKPLLFEKLSYAFTRSLYQSRAALVIIPMQDLLSLDDKARMNIPSTLGGNWVWRMNGKHRKKLVKTSEILLGFSKTYFRYEGN